MPNNTVSLQNRIPVQCALSAHANDGEGHAGGEKSQQKLHIKKKKIVHVKYIIQVVSLYVEGFRLPVHVDSFCMFVVEVC